MQKGGLKRILFGVLGIVFWLNASPIKEPLAPPLGTLFYQPLLKDQINWEQRFAQMKRAKIDRLVLQWSAYGQVDFLDRSHWLEEILSAATLYHIEVIVGLYGDELYFKHLEDPNLNLSFYLRELLTRNLDQAKRIISIAKDYDSFKGWYLYDEIDDTNFDSISRQATLRYYLRDLAMGLEKLTPKMPRYISGYFSGHLSPEAYAAMFSLVTQGRYWIFLQSGIGAGLVNAKQSLLYIKSFNRIFGANFTPIIEGFRFEKKVPKAVDYQHLTQQVKLISGLFKDRKLALFSLRYFFADGLYQAYVESHRLGFSIR